MKRYTIPALAILGFFGILAGVLKSVDSPTLTQDNDRKVERALRNLRAPMDTSTISVPHTPKPDVPTWGTLKASVVPKSESFTFNAPKTDKKIAKNDAAKKKDDKKKKNKKIAKKKKKPGVLVKKLGKDPAPTPSAPISEDGNNYTGGGSPAMNKARQNGDLPQTQEEWEEYLMNSPTTEKLMTFIKYHQAKVVTDKIFYAVCEKMVVSNYENIRKFALIALGSSPSLESFSLISQANVVERSSGLINLIDTDFQVYLSLQYVNVLAPALKSEKESVRYYAAINIGRSAQMNMTASTPASEISGRGRNGTINTSSRYYQGFIPVLQQVASEDNDERVRDAAQRSLDIINALISAHTVAAYP